MAQLTGETVLIVEDEGLQAVDLMAALQSAGAEVIAATSMEDAVSAAQHKRISAAVLDIKLERGMDCTHVCQFLKQNRVPFIFHTAHTKHGVLAAFPHVPVVPKTASKTDLLESLVGVLCSGDRRGAK